MAVGDDLAIDDALDVPQEQRVHVLAALIDLVRAALTPPQAQAIIDRREHESMAGARPMLARAVLARLRGDRDAADELAEDVARSDQLAVLIVLAPLLRGWRGALARAPRALAALASWVPQAERTALLASPPAHGLEDLLVGFAPFLDGDDLRRAQQLSMSVSPPAVRALVVRALDEQAPPPRFYDALEPAAQVRFSALRWWPTERTLERCRALESRLAALAVERRARALEDAIERAYPRVHGQAGAPPPRGMPGAGGGAAMPPRSSEPSAIERGFDSRDAIDIRGPVLGRVADPAATAIEPVHPPSQQVMLGFSDRERPLLPVDLYSLAVGRGYWLWVEIGPHEVAGAIGGGEALPPLDAGDELDVVVFGFPGELELDDAQRHGAITLRGALPGRVTRAAARPAGAERLDAQRLFFPITTPAAPGRYALRVNVYFRNLLLQSHLVTALVAKVPTMAYEPYTRRVDYALTHAFELSALARSSAHQLSILLNDNADGTHGFRFFGGAGFIEDATIDPVTLGTLIEYARGALREISWGTRTPWQSLDKTPYKYDAPTAQQVGDDLIELARHGYRLWAEALAAFGVRGPKLRTLQEMMRAPAPLQIALKQSAAHVFPVALVYDHPFSSTAKAPTICPRFAAALAAGEDLAGTECFLGHCPSWGDVGVVCASGFWGFRHDIGVPLHLGDRGEVATSVLRGEAGVRLMAGISTDPMLRGRAAHLGALAKIAGITVDPRDDHDGCMDALEKGGAQVTYFYCHGGLTDAGTPYLEVGPPHSEPIVADSLINRVWWEPRRPLVVLNGCHTTAATPEQTFDLVQGFIIHANAAGVIGTEITIFEPLATRFGEVFVREFVGGAAVGAAIRRARLALLRERNPLGLVYLPFALATLTLADA